MGGSHLSLFDFYLFLILELYVVHWICLSLIFSKSPSLLKTESGCKSYDRFHLPNFSVGANPVRTGIFTGRPVSGRRCRAVHRPVRRLYRGCIETHPEHDFGAGPVLAGLCIGRSGAEPGETDF
jgi:hypothetical protein